MPTSKVEALAPSEHADWIFLEGRPSCLSIDFSGHDLQRFFEKWLTPDGRSKNPKFECQYYSYQYWWDHHGHHTPTLERPRRAGVSIWIDSSIGLLHHTISETNLKIHPSTQQNIWRNACEKWPQLRKFKLEQFRRGFVNRDTKDPAAWAMIWDAPPHLWADSLKPETWKPMLKWLHLPADTQINVDDW